MSETKKQLAEKFVNEFSHSIKKIIELESSVKSLNTSQMVKIVEKILQEQHGTTTNYENLRTHAWDIIGLIPLYIDYQKDDKNKADEMRNAAATVANMQKTPENVGSRLMHDHFLGHDI